MITEFAYLYVEDDALSREALELVFRRVMNIEHLWIFEDSADFLSRLKALPRVPDIVLLDIHLKPYSGFELLDMIRSTEGYEYCRVVAVTASVMNEEVAMLRDSGFDGVIGKPIDIGSLPELIERIGNGEAVWHVTG